jgi:phage-related protein
MTTPTFPTSIQPTYNTVKSSQPRVNVAQFGSGYAQRAIFGINNNPKQYQLTFNVSETDADTIETFLDARAGQEKFTFTPPNESSSSKFICPQWSKTVTFANRAEISVTFIEVFEA